MPNDLDQRVWMLKLIADLSAIYAKDISETANVAATDVIKLSFKADAAAIFYTSGEGRYLYCVAGTQFPIALSPGHWRESVVNHSEGGHIRRFGPWSLPGMDTVLPLWISCPLYTSNANVGFVFLGRSEFDWSDEEIAVLRSIVEVMAPIVQVRYERTLEERGRRETEQRLVRNERKLRAFFEGSRDMIYTANSRDEITGINAAGLSLLGIAEKEAALGKPIADFVVDRSVRKVIVSKIMRNGYASDCEVVFKKADGAPVFGLESVYAIKNSAGRIIEIQGIIKDISERIANESALWKMNLELAETNKALTDTQALMIQREKMASIGQLAAGVAHEINNPLGFLKSNHETLKVYMRKLREAFDEARSLVPDTIGKIEAKLDLGYYLSELDSIFSESDEGYARIMNIVGSLKSFSRSDQVAGFEPYDVNAGIESTLVVARNEIKYVADVKLYLQPLPKIMAKSNEINQVVLNIIVNAAQAIGSQGRKDKGHILIATEEKADAVVITIRDDGPGIPKEYVDKVFDPFFTTKEPGKGTGLGLSISYDIIHTKHGGTLSVSSSRGGGTLFSIELPKGAPPA